MERDAALATEERARGTGQKGDWTVDDHRRYVDELQAPLTYRGEIDRGETLKKIHAQSSAETSGLGDSLQLIHAHSSTETSGYAETIPSPTTASYSPTGVDTGSFTTGMADRHQRVRRQLTDSVTETGRRSDVGPFPDPGPLQKRRSGRPTIAGRARSIDSAAKPDVSERPDAGTDGSPGRGMSGRRMRHDHGAAGTSRYEALPDDDAPRPLFETPKSAGNKWRRPEFLAEFAPPLSRENSVGSSADESTETNLFFGRGTQSTWLQWSHARRASFKQKIEWIDERQKEEAKNRVTTPVLKARKESLMFVSTDSGHMCSQPQTDTKLMVCSQLPREIATRSVARRKHAPTDTDDVKLTVMQWRALVAFWEHPLFVRSRCGGIVLSVVAFACSVFSIATQDWWRFDGHPCYGQSHSGPLVICSTNSTNCSSIFDRGFNLGTWRESYKNASGAKRWDMCLEEKSYWQWGIIVAMAFSMSFAILAIALSACGVFAATLSRKIYYYHSAGEIYVISAASFASSLVLFPLLIAHERSMSRDHTYGRGYTVGWVATFIFVVSSICLCLDDIVRMAVRVLGLCFPDGMKHGRM